MTFHFVYIFTNSNVEMYIFASQSLHLIDREYIYFTNWYIYTLIRKCKNLLNSFHFLFSSNSIIISFLQQTCLQKCFIPARKIIKKKTIINNPLLQSDFIYQESHFKNSKLNRSIRE